MLLLLRICTSVLWKYLLKLSTNYQGKRHDRGVKNGRRNFHYNMQSDNWALLRVVVALWRLNSLPRRIKLKCVSTRQFFRILINWNAKWLNNVNCLCALQFPRLHFPLSSHGTICNRKRNFQVLPLFSGVLLCSLFYICEKGRNHKSFSCIAVGAKINEKKLLHISM